MTDTRRTPPRSAPAQHRRPFTHDPGQWEAERARVLHPRHVRDTACTTGCEPVLVHEHPWWGWLAWTVPGDATLPDRPRQVGLALGATRLQRLSLRWLTRRPARRTALASAVPGSLRLTAAVLALIGLVTGLFAIAHGVRVGVALPAMLLAPLLAAYLPEWLDSRALHPVRSVEGDSVCRYLHRLSALHSYLVPAAAGRDRHEGEPSGRDRAAPAAGSRRPAPEAGHPVGLGRNHRPRAAGASTHRPRRPHRLARRH